MSAPRPVSVVVFGLLLATVIVAIGCSGPSATDSPDTSEGPTESSSPDTSSAPDAASTSAPTTETTTPSTPATLAEAEAALDLATFPSPAGAQVMGHRRLASLNYSVSKPSAEVLEFNASALTKLGWKEVEGSRREGQFAGASFTHGDFLLDLSLMGVSPTGPITVTFSRHGNVPLTSLPRPKGVKLLYSFPASVMYVTDAEVKPTAKSCQEVMVAAGWTPYGSAGDTAYYRQNAVLVSATVMSAPGQGGRTVITFTSSLLSLSLPAPPDTIDLRYDDGTTVLSFDTDSTPAEVANFYRKALGGDGWKSTTDEPVAIDWKQFTIFRKPGQQMLTIETHEFEGHTRVSVDHQTAAEVAQQELLATEESAERATFRDGEKPEVAIITGGAAAQQDVPYSLRLVPERGATFAAGEAVAEALIADGWNGDPATKGLVFRTRMLKKGDALVWVISVEPPKAAPWVSVVGIGATLKAM